MEVTMKRSLTCPKCGNTHLLYIAKTADHDRGVFRHAQLAITSELPGCSPPKYEAAGGEMDAMVCRACGYAEYYVSNPASIPIDGQFVREIVGPAQTTP